MSELKFSCSQCSQHIAVDDAWSGQQIKCPGCQADIVVPFNPNRSAPPPVLPVSGSRLATPPAAAQSTLPSRPAAPNDLAPVKFWILALAPLPLAFLGFLAMGVGILVSKSMYGSLAGLIFMVPSVLCAHAAINEKNSSRAISGSQAGGIGAVIAYVGMIIAYLLILMVLFRTGQVTYYRMTGNPMPQSRASSRDFESSASSTTTTSGSRRPSRPADPPVTTDPKSVTIPDGVPSGTLLGFPFTCTGIRYSPTTGVLDIDQGMAANPQAFVKLFLFNNQMPLAGKTFVVAPDGGTSGIRPNIHLKSANGKIDAVSRGYVLRLEFSEPDAKGILTGHLYLELSQSYQTKVSGTFKLQAQ